MDEAWFVMGDFNAVLDMSDVRGASGDIRQAMEEFQSCVIETGLTTLPMQGKPLRGIIAVRMAGACGSVLIGELRKQKWDLSLNVHLAKEFLAEAQGLLADNRHDETLLLLKHCCKIVLMRAVKLEQIMLRLRAKMQWLKGGDQCSWIFFTKGAELAHLRPWAKHVVSEEEGEMLTAQKTIKEVKEAFFDIKEDKAPGPDEFSVGFYKAAWPVVGHEVHNPLSVGDFRPISCCNVPYKVITKILVKRLRLQHTPLRCVMKVDLRKAYGMVEWDFLLATLELFNFSTIVIGWIREYVMTTSFSIALNGGIHDFFSGSRGR
ncbi:UNVERIFIED_CONTAM: hypothetical protein Sindi_1267500 [Sesamum indicum]